MRKRFKFLTVILSFMVFLGSFTACNSNTDELTFLSFNICTSSSSGVDADKATSWAKRREAVLKFINNSGADVIALQEVSDWMNEDTNQRIYLEKNLKSNYELIYFGKEVALATIYDKTVFNLVSQEKYWFSDTPDVKSNGWDGVNYRSAAVLILERKATGETIRAINTHGPLDDGGNVKSFELVAERSLSGENDPFTVMLGDFNASPGKLGYVPIAEKLQDCRLTAEESINFECNSYNGYGKYPDVETSPRIYDYCFVTRSENVRILSYKTCIDRFGESNDYLSDHYAVQATVKIHNTGE